MAINRITLNNIAHDLWDRINIFGHSYDNVPDEGMNTTASRAYDTSDNDKFFWKGRLYYTEYDIPQGAPLISQEDDEDNYNCYPSQSVFEKISSAVGSINQSLNQKMTKAVDYVTAGKKANTTLGTRATAEGYNNTASGNYSHAEGTDTTASGVDSHAEGYNNTASGNYSHVSGHNNTASGQGAFVCGSNNSCSGYDSFISGTENSTDSYSVQYCNISGAGNIGYFMYQNMCGAYGKKIAWNQTDGYTIFNVGAGSSDSSRSNMFRITHGNAYLGAGSYNTTGADYAEMFEWKDGNKNSEDRKGLFVSLRGSKIELAESLEDVIGIVSSNPSVCGDVFNDQWKEMYLEDIFGNPVWEDHNVEVKDGEDEDGKPIIRTVTIKRKKLNPAYDPEQEYIPRSVRPEWDAVGMLGKLIMVDDGTAEIDGYVKPSTGGKATKSDERTRYRVMERIDETHIRILILMA